MDPRRNVKLVPLIALVLLSLVGLILLLQMSDKTVPNNRWRGHPTHTALSSKMTITQTVNTFSVIGFDPKTGDLGVAVASKFFAVGAVVPFIKSGVGAIATQSFANTTYGPNGLAQLTVGSHPKDVIQMLTSDDSDKDMRQVGIVDAEGGSATYTGAKCIPWAGGRSGPNYAIQGNILTGEEVVIKMESAFKETEGELADKLMAALEAGDAAGGDSRGKQSAALVVERKGAGYGGFDDRYIDLRVDDQVEPILELRRLYGLKQIVNLEIQAYNYSQKKEYDKAIELMQKVLRIEPDNAAAIYDLACFLSLKGEREDALRNLKRALELDPKLKGLAKGDRDLDNLRELKEFKELIG